jgi:hypothetical protein
MPEKTQYPEAWETNIKAGTDNYLTQWQSAAQAAQGLQAELNEQHLRFVDDEHTLVMLMLKDAAGASGRLNANGVLHDHLASLAALTPPEEVAQAAIASKIAEEVSPAVSNALKTSMAQAALTSAPAEGSTGVAHAGLQTPVPVELAEIMVNMIESNKALSVKIAELVAKMK